MKRKYIIPFLLVSIFVISLSFILTKINKTTFEKSYAADDEEGPQIATFQTNTDESNQIVPGQVIVKFKSNTNDSQKRDAFGKHNIVKHSSVWEDNYESVETTAGEEITTANSLQSDPNIEYAEPVYYVYANSTPNDPMFNQQWYLQTIKAPSAWDITIGNNNVNVAILDSGIAQNHPDVTSKVTKWTSFAGDQYDKYGHGTHLAGVVAAVTNNSLGIAGVGQGIKLFSAKVLNNKGAGSTTDAASGIRWAADNGANIINMSFGGPDECKCVEDAINYAWSKGVVLIAAAGNTPNSKKEYPAAYNNVFSVAATGPSDKLASFSTRGTWVDIAAPGVNILSTFPEDEYIAADGTSMSSPVVAGVAALIKSAYPNYTNQQIVDRLCSTADKISGTGKNFTCGRVNAYQAVLGGGSVGPTPTPTAPPADPTRSLIFKLRFQGVTDKGRDQNIKITLILNGSTKYSGTLMGTSDNDGLYTVMVDNSKETIPIGTYELKVKGTSSLQRKIANLTYSGGGQTFDLTKQENQVLRAGDVNGDNKITISDASQVLMYYLKFSVPVDNTAKMEASDVNKDGTITIQDVALIGINWSEFSVQGDN